MNATRAFLRCPDCKVRTVVTLSATLILSNGGTLWDVSGKETLITCTADACTDAGARPLGNRPVLMGKTLRHTHSPAKACGFACRDAVSEICKCSCDGSGHGAGPDMR